MRNPTLIGAVLAGVLCFASSAHATSVQPYTSASAPATITSPLVTFTPYDPTEGIFAIAVGSGVTCPDTPVAYTLTFSDPSGTASIALTDPCVAIWGPITPPVTSSEDFTVDLVDGVDLTSIFAGLPLTQAQDGPAIADFDITNNATTPFLYQVSTPSGVVAEAAMTRRIQTSDPNIVDQKTNIDQFINICIDGGYTLYSHNGGDLYCNTGGVDEDSFVNGWPAPPPPVVAILAGPWATGQQGYGHAKPSTIFNGGDPTGLVRHIHWASWGATKATGTGVAEYVGPHQDVAHGKDESARIVAFHLGVCHGRMAYNAIDWYFPQHRQHFSPTTYIDPCTGAYHGQ